MQDGHPLPFAYQEAALVKSCLPHTMYIVMSSVSVRKATPAGMINNSATQWSQKVAASALLESAVADLRPQAMNGYALRRRLDIPLVVMPLCILVE